jgi:hypothetical protein
MVRRVSSVMSSNLRADLGAGRLQRIVTMRLLRVASAGALALVALLMCVAAPPSARRMHDVGGSSAVTRGIAPELRSAGTDELPTSRTARQAARVLVRHQPLARARGTYGDGETTLTSALLASPARLFGDRSASARAKLRRLAQRHAPYAEASPFDATAPPTASGRNG